MESIALRTPANGEFTTADRLDPGLVVAPPDRAYFTAFGTRTGPGTLLLLTPATGVRAAIASMDIVVSNAAGIAGGSVTVSMSRTDNARANVTADAPGAYSTFSPTIHVPATPNVGFQVLDLIGGLPHYTIPYNGTHPLVRLTSALGAADIVSLWIRFFVCAATPACGG